MATRGDQRYIALNVQCVATGVRHDNRAVCFVALVDFDGNVLLEKKVKPEVPVVSYLTPLTGMRQGDLDTAEGITNVIAEVKALLGPNVTLVMQASKRSIEWLDLNKGEDYGDIEELSQLFRRYNPRYGSYSHYSLRHEIDTLLYGGKLSSNPNPLQDAIDSMRLFKRYREEPALTQAKEKLARSPAAPSFAKRYNNMYEGVCLGASGSKGCRCDAPRIFS